MGTLVQKTPQNEYLNGVWHSLDRNTRKIIKSVPFKYGNYNQDSETEQQPLPGYQVNKLSNMIFTSSAIVPKAGDRFDLEDQPNTRKAISVDPDRTKNSDLRLKNVKNKMLYTKKIITFE